MLHISMIEVGVSPLQPKKHTPSEWVYKKYKATRTQLLRKADGA
jgi:hypothetical protein